LCRLHLDLPQRRDDLLSTPVLASGHLRLLRPRSILSVNPVQSEPVRSIGWDRFRLRYHAGTPCTSVRSHPDRLTPLRVPPVPPVPPSKRDDRELIVPSASPGRPADVALGEDGALFVIKEGEGLKGDPGSETRHGNKKIRSVPCCAETGSGQILRPTVGRHVRPLSLKFI
jgi:hypothetical protein